MPSYEVLSGDIGQGIKWSHFANGSFINTGTYIGNGTSQQFALKFTPKLIIIFVESTKEIMLKIDQFSGSEFYQTVGGTGLWAYETANGITISSLQFSVGSSSTINNNGVTYKYLAIG